MMVVVDDLLNIRRFKDLLSSVDVIIHLAATWDPELIERVNVHPVNFFLSLQKDLSISPQRAFSTPSAMSIRIA